MRKKTLHHVVAITLGALVGGGVVFISLARLGSREDGGTVTPAATATSRPSPSPSPAASPSPSAAASVSPSPAPEVSVSAAVIPAGALGVSFVLPEGYRVASELNLFEETHGNGEGRTFTITRAEPAQEEAYIVLVKQLREAAAETGAPAFSPGKTLTLQVVTSTGAERSDATFARARERVEIAPNVSGTRYRRVEGVQTVDVTYVDLPNGRRVTVTMTYAPEEPVFDDVAYMGVLTSLRPL